MTNETEVGTPSTRDVLIRDLRETRIPKETETPETDAHVVPLFRFDKTLDAQTKVASYEFCRELELARNAANAKAERYGAVLDYIARVPMERSQVMEMARKASEQK